MKSYFFIIGPRPERALSRRSNRREFLCCLGRSSKKSSHDRCSRSIYVACIREREGRCSGHGGCSCSRLWASASLFPCHVSGCMFAASVKLVDGIEWERGMRDDGVWLGTRVGAHIVIWTTTNGGSREGKVQLTHA